MSASFDPRVTPVRDGIAARHMMGQVDATRFVEGEPATCLRSHVSVTGRPDPAAPNLTELLLGEAFVVYERVGGFAWGQATRDGYVGFVPEAALGPPLAHTHRVAALMSHLYPAPDIRTQPLASLPLSALVRVEADEGRWARLAHGWLHARHLEPLDATHPDWVAEALRLLGVPYVWGGRTPFGIDCSGLVQLALERAGVACPRDSDMQERALGTAVVSGQPERRGDLVFSPGHVAIALDAQTVLHANGFALAVTIEPLSALLARVTQESPGRPAITAVKRL
ncbi:C40 family peptidase [Zavarzinia sp. CC-PAN008]|uniref:C40 family peptidase n=1 Tax=Zavarzinia sp. CC-PAN008 TaxID=3243332 RepID=UPI003F7453A0